MNWESIPEFYVQMTRVPRSNHMPNLFLYLSLPLPPSPPLSVLTVMHLMGILHFRRAQEHSHLKSLRLMYTRPGF